MEPRERLEYNKDTGSVECSAELLCTMAVAKGDLGGFSPSFGRPGRLDLGAVAALLQKESGGFYMPVEELSFTLLSGGMYFTVRTEKGGMIRDGEGLISDTVVYVRDYGFRMPPDELLTTRMACYAYALAVRHDLPAIRTRITYIHTETQKTKYFTYRYTVESLKEHCATLLAAVERRAGLLIRRQLETLPAARQAVFPYSELREGQEMLIRETHSAIRRGKRLFAEAPTGIGKTASSLYGAIRALGEEWIDKIFYLTAKASTGREAYRAAAKFCEHGTPLKTVMITAKEAMCLCGNRDTAGRNPCNAADCPYARGYYEKAPRAVCDLLESGNGFPSSRIRQVAQEYGICPYELSLDLSEWCDLIICDYNYAFDPAVYFRRYFSDSGYRERYVFLIDEAHNLADRAREMYSSTLRRSTFEQVAQQCCQEESLSLSFAPVVMHLSRLRELCEDTVKDDDGNEMGFYLSHVPMEALREELDTFRKACEKWLRGNEDSPLVLPLWRLLSEVKHYLLIHSCFDRGFLTYVTLFGGDITVKTYCLDPSPTMNALLNRATSAVLFSATLSPPEYYCDVLGGRAGASTVSLPSPFDPDHLCVAVADYLSLRMEHREKSYGRYATVIAATVSAKPGNYIAYFPSYHCLEKVYRAFHRKYPKVETVVQQPGMGEGARETFLSAFRKDEGHLRIGFCVMGGAFSEGVDLPGSRLIGTIIFGTGLPGLSNERNIIAEYFDRTIGEGYDYAYTYPGMTRVLQAVGRVIRQDGDRGVAILVDDRYGTGKYRSLFPAHWRNVQYAGNAPSLAEIVRRFWENQEKNR